MAIKKELESALSSTIKTTYWTIGHLEVLPNSNGEVRVRYRLDGYVSEEDYRANKQVIDTRHIEKTMKKSEIEVWGYLYEIVVSDLVDFGDAEKV